MPMFHANSTWISSLMHMIGAECVVYPSGGYDAAEVLTMISEYKVTWTSLVPTMLIRILNVLKEAEQRFDLTSMRLLLCSSAPLMTKTKEETLQFFKGIDIYEAYGATETGWVTMLKHEDELEKVQSVGRPIFGQSVKLLGDSGEEIALGQVGEIFSCSAGRPIREYWRKPDTTKKGFRYNNEWFTVGDMARADKDGFFYLEGRKEDMIITGGENVHPAEVENIISLHPKVDEVSVIGVPDDLWGERVHAVVRVKGDEKLKETEVIDFCRDRMAGYKRPRSVEFVDDFPKTPTGKIQRRLLREKYWSGGSLYK
jgi:long-chain acyl-CoA synthetase